MKEPVDHILRPTVPWRTAGTPLSECGLESWSVKTISRDQFLSRLVEYGQTRTAMITCMTCYETARRWKTWSEDPLEALQREIAFSSRKRSESLRREFLAIAALIHKHRAEFDSLVMLYDFEATATPPDAGKEER